MVILAVETVTRAGSLALWQAGACTARSGPTEGTHGERLPAEATSWLATLGRSIDDVDLFAVVSGPGSFTGLRVGMAAVQGLALATKRLVIGVPTLDALATGWQLSHPTEGLVVACLDGQRGDVFYAGWRTGSDPTVLDGRSVTLAAGVATPLEAASRVAAVRRPGESLIVVGSGGRRYPEPFETLGDARVVDDPLTLAEGAVRLAATRPDRASLPHALRPLYLRRPDAVLARERAGLPPARAGEFVVERASRADVPAIEALQRETFTRPWDAKALEWELDQAGAARLYVMRGPDRSLVAFCSCWVVVDELHINSLAVASAWRRRGLATRLLRDIFREVRPDGVRAATLEVRASNAPALALYQGLGFVVEGTRRDYYLEPREDALVLWCRQLP